MATRRAAIEADRDTPARSAAAAMYEEFTPPPDLAGVVACTWVARAGNDSSPGPIIPDACSDIVVVGDSAPHVAGPAEDVAAHRADAAGRAARGEEWPGVGRE
jgi:hypothetical protein